MWRSERRGASVPVGDLSLYDLAEMGLRVLAGRRLGFFQRRAGFVVLASDVDEEAGAAAVWLVRRPGARDSREGTLQFERDGGRWQYLGAAGGPGREFSLARRPSVSVDGPMNVMRLVSSGAGRSRTDRERQVGGLGVVGAGWVACAGFRLAAEVGHLQVSGRSVRVPDHGYAVVVWRSPPALTRPVIVAVGEDGSPLSELGPTGSLDRLTWESIEKAASEDPS